MVGSPPPPPPPAPLRHTDMLAALHLKGAESVAGPGLVQPLGFVTQFGGGSLT